MTAGLPKSRSLFLIIALFLSVSIVSFSQETQTPSLLPIEPVDPPVVQTPSVTLDAIIAAIELNPVATPEQQGAMLDALGPAVEAGLLAEEHALEILSVIGWSSLEDSEKIDKAILAVAGVTSQLLAGVILEDPVAELADLWAEALTPDGIVNAIGKAADRAGLDPATADPVLDEVERLIAAGFPPGIVLRVVKDAIREGEDPLEALAVLEAAAEDGSYGQAANTATGNGQNKYEETEENANQEPSDEPEAEDNNHGQGQNGKKTEDDEPKTNNGKSKKP